MKILLTDLTSPLKHPGCYGVIIASVFCLWLGLGSDAPWILRGMDIDISSALLTSLNSPGHLLSLPLLAALPASAAAYRELRCGVARLAVFRCGRRLYILGKLIAVLLLAPLTQLMALLLFMGLLHGLHLPCSEPLPLGAITARLLFTSMSALTGSIAALATWDEMCAYAIPVAACFSVSMLASRFLLQVPLLNPAVWLSGGTQALLLVTGFVILLTVTYSLQLYKEVWRRA